MGIALKSPLIVPKDEVSTTSKALTQPTTRGPKIQPNSSRHLPRTRARHIKSLWYLIPRGTRGVRCEPTKLMSNLWPEGQRLWFSFVERAERRRSEPITCAHTQQTLEKEKGLEQTSARARRLGPGQMTGAPGESAGFWWVPVQRFDDSMVGWWWNKIPALLLCLRSGIQWFTQNQQHSALKWEINSFSRPSVSDGWSSVSIFSSN